MQKWGKYGVEYSVKKEDCLYITELEAQRKKGVTIFGGGFILGTRAAAERAAAERAAAERAAVWELGEAEREIIKYIDKRSEKSDAGI